ncbi:MAG: MFS transporter [Desulfohalobiaceae bacterium]
MPKMSSNEKNILFVTCLAHFLTHFNMLMFPALVLPLTRLYEISISQALSLSFPMYLLYGLSALPWGLLSDKIGARPLILLFYLGSGLSAVSAVLFLGSSQGLALSLAGLGLFSGIYHPAGLGLISRGMTRISMALGYNGMAGNAGLASAPLVTGAINHFLGLQAAFIFLAGLSLLGGLIMLVSSLQEPEKSQEAHQEQKQNQRPGLQAFAVLCVCMMLGGMIYRGVTVILPSYFELQSESLFVYLESLGSILPSRNVGATVLTSLVFLVGIAGQYLGGMVAERFDPRRGYLVFHALAMPLALLMSLSNNLWLLLVSICYALFLLGMQPIENTLVARLTPDKLRHSGYGVKFVLTFGVGALSVRLLGWVQQAWSLPHVFQVLALLSLGLVCCILLLIFITKKFKISAWQKV